MYILLEQNCGVGIYQNLFYFRLKFKIISTIFFILHIWYKLRFLEYKSTKAYFTHITHTYTHIHKYICVYTHTHTHIYICNDDFAYSLKNYLFLYTHKLKGFDHCFGNVHKIIKPSLGTLLIDQSDENEKNTLKCRTCSWKDWCIKYLCKHIKLASVWKHYYIFITFTFHLFVRTSFLQN